MDEERARKNDPRNKDAERRDKAQVYKSFWAIELAHQFGIKKGGLPVFGLDKRNPVHEGAKRYITAGYDIFYNNYARMHHTCRCFYETILPGLPCHFHTDEEFIREKNPEKKDDQTHALIMNEIFTFMKELGIIQSPDEIDVKVMDSSNARKMSKHTILVFKDGRRFKNNYHCGAFMRRLKLRVIRMYGNDPATNPFLVRAERKKKEEEEDPDKGVDTAFDVTIYTFRRQYRLYGSSKRKGDYRPLVLDGEDKMKTDIDKKTMYSTLIQRIEDYSTLKLVECMEEDGSEPQSTSKKRDKASRPRYNPRDVSYSHVQNRDARGSYSSDPIPEIADRVCKVIEEAWDRKSGSHGECKLIPKSYTAEYKTLYCWSTSKYCAIKEDFHTGNHVTFMIFLGSLTYSQRCFSEKGSCTSASGEKKTSPRYNLDLDSLFEDEIRASLTSVKKEYSLLWKAFMRREEYISYIPKEVFM